MSHVSRISLSTKLLPLIGVALLCLSGCGPAPSSWAIHERWIDVYPNTTVDLDKDPDPAESAAEGDVHVTILSKEARPARCTTPDQPWTRQVSIPPNAKLRFGFGLPPTAAAPLTFRIRIGVDGREDEVVFSKTLGPRRKLWRGWRDAEVDLAPYAGTSARISLEHGPKNPDAEPGIGCWSGPEILNLAPRAPLPNVVLISLDTLRADGLSIYGNPRPTSPNIDRWAREHGVVFTRAVAAAPWTLPSHASMFTGVEAISHGASHNGPAPRSLVMLAEMLRDAGYATMAVTGGAYLHPQFGLEQGFDLFKYWPDGSNSWDEVDAVTGAATKLLERSDDSPFFLLIHTYEVHNRGRPREEFFREFSALDPDLRIKVIKDDRVPEDGYMRRMRSKLKMKSSDEGWIELPEEARSLPRDIYDSRVNYADLRLAPILDLLSTEPLNRNTIVILTSDHGEMLGEHGGLAGHIYLYEENLLIPLIIAGDTRNAVGASISQQVRSIDIVPTVLELAGLEPGHEFDGRSLVPVINGEEPPHDRQAWSYVATSNRGLSLTTPSFKFIFNDTAWSPVNQTVRFYDLQAPAMESRESDCPDELGVELRSQAVSMALTTMSGMRLRFTNNLDEPITGTLHGPPISLSRIKSVGAVSPKATIVYPRSSTARISIPPGADFTVFLMDTKGNEFSASLEGASAALPRWEGTFSDSGVGPGRLVRFDRREWREEQFGPATRLDGIFSLIVLPDRSNPTASESPEDLDDELRAQLEALGYL